MMPIKTVLICLLLISLGLSAWLIANQTHDNVGEISSASDKPNARSQSMQTTAQKRVLEWQTAPREQSGMTAHMRTVNELLAANRYESTSEYINQHYSELSSVDLETLRIAYRTRESQLRETQNSPNLLRLLQSETEVYNDLSAWSRLSQAAVSAKQWRLALDTGLNASLLENDGQKLAQWQRQLVAIASNVRVELENQSDELGVLALYQSLSNAHPNYPRFQLELAYAHLRLDQIDQATPYLEALQYDLELGDVSKSVLAKLTEHQSASSATPSDSFGRAPPATGYRVPLQRLGTNLIASVSVNQRTLPMLLDTGASITALDSQVISRLNLVPINQQIQISTANGVRQAHLYRVSRLQLGRFELQNHIVAGIELGTSSQFSGLLGTDVLNALGGQYSYVIDNAQSALIFRPKH